MAKTLVSSFKDGFFGAFKLALALVLSITGVASAFVHGGGDAAMNAARHTRDAF